MVLASMVLQSKGEPSFPNPSLAQMQILPKYLFMSSRGFYLCGRHILETLFIVCACLSI